MTVRIVRRQWSTTIPDPGPPTITLQPMQPMTFVYDTVSSTMDSYETPGALVVAGRQNYADQRFVDVSNGGGTVLIYFDAIVRNTTGFYHDLLFNSSSYGASVPEWPGPVSANSTGNLADFRVGGVLQSKLQGVLQKIVDDNPHMGGFFADDLGSRSWFPNFDWSTFGTTNQNSYRAGAIAVAQAFRTVADANGLICVVNGTWVSGSTSTNGGGYPAQNTHGCSLADGGVVEHHDTADAFWQAYVAGSQWADASPLLGSVGPAHIVIGSADAERAQWAALGNIAFYVNQTGYSSAVTPWGSFHATGLPTHPS